MEIKQTCACGKCNLDKMEINDIFKDVRFRYNEGYNKAIEDIEKILDESANEINMNVVGSFNILKFKTIIKDKVQELKEKHDNKKQIKKL